MPSRVLLLLLAAACLAAAPAARARTDAPANGSFWAGNLAPGEPKYSLAPPRDSALGADRDGGIRFGARLSGPGGTWTLDHSDSHWRGRAAHRFRLGFSRRF